MLHSVLPLPFHSERLPELKLIAGCSCSERILWWVDDQQLWTSQQLHLRGAWLYRGWCSVEPARCGAVGGGVLVRNLLSLIVAHLDAKFCLLVWRRPNASRRPNTCHQLCVTLYMCNTINRNFVYPDTSLNASCARTSGLVRLGASLHGLKS